jgi:hypothetical protein
VELGKINFQNGGKSILLRIYQFLFKTKHYSKLKERESLPQSEKSEDSNCNDSRSDLKS